MNTFPSPLLLPGSGVFSRVYLLIAPVTRCDGALNEPGTEEPLEMRDCRRRICAVEYMPWVDIIV